ncbi:MAG: diguanylate cyclase [Betaproteobacteria bacterium]|nr:diguanylate cyclase [Betaproteobacteria bacterium]
MERGMEGGVDSGVEGIMDAPDFSEADFSDEIAALRARLQRRTPALTKKEFSKLATTALAAFDDDALRETAGNWLDGTFYLARYEETKADASLASAREGIEALVMAAPTALEVHALAVAINEASAELAFARNDYRAVFGFAQALWSQAMATADYRRKGAAATWLGVAQAQMGRYQEASRTLARAVADYDHAGASNEAARAMNALAVCYVELGGFDRAYTLYAHALHRAEADRHADMQGRILANWGDALVQHGRVEEGMGRLKSAIALLKGIGAHWHYAWCELALAKAYALRGEDETAGKLMHTALKSVRKSDAPRIEAEILAGIGEYAARHGEDEFAIQNLNAALAIAARLGIDREVFKTHKLLADTHRQFGRFEKALEHFELFHNVRAKVFDEVARARVAEIESTFELEKTKRDRELFQLRNVELASALSEVQRLNAELGEKARVLEDMSNHDALTGLANRRYLFGRLHAEAQRFERYGTRYCVAIYDIDHFKLVNDTHAHAVGDEVLRAVARLIDAQVRDSDVHARYGGEEFALILPSATREEAMRVMDKLRDTVEAHDWTAFAPGLRVTISAGVAESGDGADGEHSPDPAGERLLARADAHLYEAKRQGRNRVCG